MTSEDRLREIKIKISERETARTRATIIKEEAEKTLQGIKTTMVESLEVSSAKELDDLIGSLQKQLDEELTRVETALNGEGA